MSTPWNANEDSAAPPSVDLAAWRELLGYVLRYRAEVALLVAQAVVTAAVDAALPLVTRRVVDRVLADGPSASLAGPAAAYATLLVVLAACIFGFIRVAGRLSTRVALDVRLAAFARLQQMSYSFFDARPTGWLMARMTSDCDRLARILAWGLLDVCWGLALMGGMAGLLLALSWKLGLVTLAVVPVLVIVSLRFQRSILQSARRVRKANSRLTAAYAEDLMAVRTTRTLAREEDSQAEFRTLTSEMHEASVRNALQSAAYLPVVTTIGSAIVAVVLVLGAGEVAAGVASVGTLVAFTLRFFDPVQEIASAFAQLQMAQAAAERVLGLVHAEPEIRDAPGVRSAPASAPRVLSYRGVSFAYGGGPRVLGPVDLEIAAGSVIALVGPTGGGKTTLAALACRFYDPASGAITADGEDLRSLPLRWWRSQIAVVPQQPFIFTGTIRENVRYGRLEATDAEVEDAARLGGALEPILALPQGWDTPVGERGVLLTTGQAQLVSIARAVLADKPILVLDEATSSVDAETEARIQDGLAVAMRGRTCLVIAHRLSTVRAADRILVIDRGLVVESGSHRELLAARGAYRELVLEQGLRSASHGASAWARA
jgi:ATP-binding cassette subfamily B protein